MKELNSLEALIRIKRKSRKTDKKAMAATMTIGCSSAGGVLGYAGAGVKFGTLVGLHAGPLGAAAGAALGFGIGSATYGITEFRHKKTDRRIHDTIKSLKSKASRIDEIISMNEDLKREIDDANRLRAREVALLVAQRRTRLFKKGFKKLQREEENRDLKKLHWRNFLCSLTMEVPEDPVIGRDGRLYDRFMLREYASISSTYPSDDYTPLIDIDFLPCDEGANAMIELAISIASEKRLMTAYGSLFGDRHTRREAVSTEQESSTHSDESAPTPSDIKLEDSQSYAEDSDSSEFNPRLGNI